MRCLFFCAILLMVSCSIKSPEFTITGQKTNLEQQVLGSYQNVRDQAIVTTSARIPDQGKQMDSQQQAIASAVKTQQFNKDEIDELKRSKVVGENNQGLLEVRPTEKYEQDQQYRELVDALVQEENDARRIIYQRVMLMNDMSEEQQTREIFARLQMDQSEAGTLIQQPNGEWVEKPKEKK